MHISIIIRSLIINNRSSIYVTGVSVMDRISESCILSGSFLPTNPKVAFGRIAVFRCMHLHYVPGELPAFMLD